MKIGSNIKRFRDRQGLTQSELASALGLHRSEISKYENEERNPRVDKLQLLANVLQVRVEDFFEESVENKYEITWGRVDPKDVLVYLPYYRLESLDGYNFLPEGKIPLDCRLLDSGLYLWVSVPNKDNKCVRFLISCGNESSSSRDTVLFRAQDSRVWVGSMTDQNGTILVSCEIGGRLVNMPVDDVVLLGRAIQVTLDL